MGRERRNDQWDVDVEDSGKCFCWSRTMIKYRITLTDWERGELQSLLSKGRHAACKLTRARVLLLSDEGKTEAEIVSALGVSAVTVERLRKRCVEEGVEAALVDRPRPGAKLKLDERQRARLIAEVCSSPGEGHARWTLKLLANRVVERKRPAQPPTPDLNQA